MLKAVCVICFYFVVNFSAAQTNPTPSLRQLNWQQMETNAFLHFTVNTFTDKEWGDGTEKESVFNPVKFNARQWIKALRDAGFKMAILTAKHHDGFCLWPTKYTTHSVKNSPWKNGKGDVVKEVSDACREYGLKFGIYLSPWDRHEATYGTNAYNTYYENELTELMTNYGTVSEVWFDGAKGANAKDMRYDFRAYWNIVRKLQPTAVIFSDAGPDVRWVGNENGSAGETCWSTIDTTGLAPGKASAAYLNSGDPAGCCWVPAESDVSIRPGWFFHASENDRVKTPQQLVNLYYVSVGHNSLLLLNIPPNRDGLLSPADVKSIMGFRKTLNETFKNNYAQGNTNALLTDKNLSTYIDLKANDSLIINFKKSCVIDRAMLQENIANGQHVEEIKLEYFSNNKWNAIDTCTTVGYKRLLRFSPITTVKIKLTLLKSKGIVQLAETGFYKSSGSEYPVKKQ